MKKRYEKPLVTDPESGKSAFIPLGSTACASGDIGSACGAGTEPQGGPTKCVRGNNPFTSECLSGSRADNDCMTGQEANYKCDVGISVANDCTRGTTPQGPICQSGNSADGSCNSGTLVGG